jgi:endonuclease YncB( thermonuclease family)
MSETTILSGTETMQETLYFYRAVAQSPNENQWLLNIDLGLDSWLYNFPVFLMIPDSYTVYPGKQLLIRTAKYEDKNVKFYVARVAVTDEEIALFTSKLFHYNCLINRFSDADSGYLDVDLGLKSWRHKLPYRLARINAYEISGEERELGVKGLNRVKELIGRNPVRIQTIKDSTEKWRRYLIELWASDALGVWVNVNDLLVTEGLARYQTY